MLQAKPIMIKLCIAFHSPATVITAARALVTLGGGLEGERLDKHKFKEVLFNQYHGSTRKHHMHATQLISSSLHVHLP